MASSDPFTLYAISTSAWGTLQSLPLLLAPRVIVSLCSPEARHITDFEAYLCRTLALTLLALAASNLVFTGVIPIGPQAPASSSSSPSTSSTSKTKERSSSGEETSSSSPPRRPGVAAKNEVGKATASIAVAFQAITTFYLYTQVMGAGWSFAFTAGLIGNGALFCFGTWTLLFGADAARVSKTTGADKRTSGFPFGNSESAREKKRESRGKKSLLRGR